MSCAGLAPVLRLAERVGLQRLTGDHVRIDTPAGRFAQVKVPALVAEMVAGADSIEGLDLLGHGGMGRLFAGVRAPSTLGTFLRTFTFGHVRQLHAVASRLLVNLAAAAPLLPGAAELAYIGVDDTVRQTYGYAKQGAGRGYTGVKGLNALLAVISTPASAPMIAAARLRRGSTSSAKGAHRLVADALVTAKASGAGGMRVLRADSAFHRYKIIATARRHGSCFSITARQDAAVRKAIAAIDADAWTPIKYTNAVYDDDQQRWISDAEVAETAYTAFTSKSKTKQVAARLIVRRVPDLNPANQSELFTVYRYKAVFTDRPLPMLEAEKAHRAHAIVEQVIADVKNGPLAHLPSGRFWADQRLARLRCDHVQPHPRRRHPRLHPARPSHHRHHPRPTDQRARQTRPISPAAHLAPAHRLAVGAGLAAAAHRHGTTARGLTHPPVREGPDRRPRGRAGAPGSTTTPRTRPTRQSTPTRPPVK